MSLGKVCRGYGVSQTTRNTMFDVVIGDGIVQSFAASQHQAPPQWNARGDRIYVEVMPPDWDFLESIRYYMHVIKPGLMDDLSTPADPPFKDDDYISAAFTCNIITYQIAKVYVSRGEVARPGHDPNLNSLWKSYYHYVLELLRILNMCIRDEGPYGGRRRVFYCVFRLFTCDSNFLLPSWQAHLKGYFAYVEHMGGVKTVLSFPTSPIYTFLYILTHAAMANTTSPPGRQIREFDHYSDEEMQKIYDYRFMAGFSCPFDIFASIIHISRLRVQVHYEKLPGPVLDAAVQQILKKIRTFDAENWVKEKGLDEENIAQLGRIYQTATLLHGILTLPRPAVVAWVLSDSTTGHPKVSNPGSIYKNTLDIYKKQLFALIREVWPKLINQSGIRWPLIVAGVAVAKGGPEVERSFVEGALLAIWASPLEGGVTGQFLGCLRDFWASGKTEWDDCFKEPMLVID
ncbi:hypothetical protein NLG97_g2587 [Lecanicillium saksenae]|uniref:Uncharacterized protein n=1 Tax=Lecanicillium saksenae TaxID=468837 RepID=A0ACC1R343_9HYPO|nr:hypothetical protein NLG97_g2587 [Lecanicillium saksenae]